MNGQVVMSTAFNHNGARGRVVIGGEMARLFMGGCWAKAWVCRYKSRGTVPLLLGYSVLMITGMLCK